MAVAELFQWWAGFGYGARSIRREVAATQLFVTGGVLVDVGAHTGAYARELVRVYGDTLESLHCFEPSRELVPELQRLAGDRVRVNSVALGRTATTGELWKVRDRPTLGSLTQRRLDHHELAMHERETVEIITLDDYAEGAGLGRIDLLKIDVEGHELDVLHGATRLLAEQRIRCIQFEFGGCNIDTRTYFQDFWYLLAVQHGFAIYRIAPLRLARVRHYSEACEVFMTTNYLAVR
jgi:FkbM family methyltransferase